MSALLSSSERDIDDIDVVQGGAKWEMVDHQGMHCRLKTLIYNRG